LREAWNTSKQEDIEKMHALTLAKECYLMKLDLLTNAAIVDDAIKLVCDKSKDKERVKTSSNNSANGRNIINNFD